MSTPASYAWVPTTARVAVVDGFGPFPRGTLQIAPSPLIWPVKDPADLLDFVVDYSAVVAGDSGDGIATLDVSISPDGAGDLMLATSRVDGNLAILWLGGGIAGTTYAVTLVVGTNGGRSLSRTVSLPVAALSGSSVLANVLVTEAGSPLTAETGLPLTTR